MHKFEEQGGEAKALGWISMSDLFMLCSIVMLAVAVAFASVLKKTDIRLTNVQGEYANYKNSNTLTLTELRDKSVQLAQESSSFKSQANGLDQQLAALKLQFADSEKQRQFYADETAKFKSQSENYSKELTIQLAKLNALQSEFDKYRSVNVASMTDLKSELVRMAKDIEGYKTNVAALHLQIGTLDSQLADSQKAVANLKLDRDKLRSDSDRLATDLNVRTLSYTSDLAKANSDKSKLNADLAKLGGEREQLLADLERWKSTSAALTKEDRDLKLKLHILEDDKKTADAKLANLEGTIVGLTGEIGELKPQINKLKIDLDGAHLRIIDLEKLVFEKIDRARLVVSVTAQDVPNDFTLELIVTDPLGNDCGPFSSVIFNEGDEIGVLQQSVDFKSGREGSQKAVFYSMRPLYARVESGSYSVKAMIRHIDNDSHSQLARPITVNCSVDLPYTKSPDAHKVAQLDITSPGYIRKVRRSSQLTASSPYKNMWPWEPSYHFERTLCDFRISGDTIANFRTFDKFAADTSTIVQNPGTFVRTVDEQKIDSIRNRGGK